MSRAVIILLATMLVACAPEDAQPAFPYFSEEGGRVRDGANILDDEFEAELTQRLDDAQARYGYEMVVVTVPSLEGYEIAGFSLEYARAWGLGHAERNDGLLVLVAPYERRVRIEVGSGIEDHFTDLFCGEVIDQYLLPAFGAGDYVGGISAGTDAMIERMRAQPTIPANDNSPELLEDAA